ncbi:hypothetical protein [Citrobacter phage IME-JL8]|uniref:Uncharacterized protein n=1 Tax=Citrobacter phage IME-JL8 TaxID=2709754 RepID=A0A6G6XT87_9CAUD|nr:hypothetical protein [Citrobacter phage IME-JL8]
MIRRLRNAIGIHLNAIDAMGYEVDVHEFNHHYNRIEAIQKLLEQITK